jgi:hypothetical protein
VRKILYVPIIHMESDLGSASPTIDNTSASLCGEERWSKHKQTVSEFWDRVKGFLDRLDSANLKIYQDGLPADGELGWMVIEEGAKRGSKNYQIILDLIKKGAEIRKTEDVALLKEEYERIIRLAQAKSRAHRVVASVGYKLRKDRLMAERDRFIAETINETLSEGETGILFIGAYHDVLPHLARDIAVEQVKEQEKVRAYFKGLISGKDEEKFEQLAAYLVSPV